MKNALSAVRTRDPDGGTAMEMEETMAPITEIPEGKEVRAAGGGMGIGNDAEPEL